MAVDNKILNKPRIAEFCVVCESAHLIKSPAILMPFVADRVFDWKPVVVDAEWGLRTISPGMAYSICNSLLCGRCKHLFLDIRFDEKEMNRLYKDYRDEGYVSLRETYEPGYRLRNNTLATGYQYLDKVERFLEPLLNFPVSILDWGGDTGKNTPFKDKSSLVHVYDISQKKPVSNGVKSVSSKNLLKYDLVVCSNVLEHVPYPREVLLKIKASLTKTSLLYVEVPFEELVRTSKSLSAAHALKRHWHEHINFFNEGSLAELLGKSGLEILSMGILDVSSSDSKSFIFQAACRLTKDCQ